MNQKLKDLIKRGENLLSKIEEYEYTDPIPSLIVTEIKTIHFIGNELLSEINYSGFEQYRELFSKEYSQILDWQKKNSYIKQQLENCLGILRGIDEIGVENIIMKRNFIKRIFISHGAMSDSFVKIESFIRVLGFYPLYDINQATQGNRINEHVEKLMNASDFYIILAFGETTNSNGKRMPNHNVTIEFDRLITKKEKKILLILEKECYLPSMQQDVIYELYDGKCLDNIYTRIIRELKSHGLMD
jgi:predicted nucleotide-binding protein